MTTCTIVLTLVSCAVDPATPRPSPAEAARVLTASVPPAAPAWRLDALDAGWGAVPPPSYDRTWPFSGTFAPTWTPRPRPADEVYLPLGYEYAVAYSFRHPYGSAGGRVLRTDRSGGGVVDRPRAAPAPAAPAVVTTAAGAGVARRPVPIGPRAPTVPRVRR